MKITNLQVIVTEEQHNIVRIDTDEGIHGYGEANWGAKGPLPKELILCLKPFILGQDPTNVERVMIRIRHMGGPAHMGVGVSAVSMALWDIAGKAAGLPVYKLLGGKVRDKVRVYCDSGSGVLLDPQNPASRYTPEAYAEKARRRKKLPEGYTVLKFDIGFHGRQLWHVPGGLYADDDTYPYRGHATERGVRAQVAVVAALKEVLGDDIGLALDAGPGQSLPAAMALAKALEPFNIQWLEDLLTGADIPYCDSQAYKILSDSTSTPILAGEEIYLRQGFRPLIEPHAVDVVAPDIHDVGGLAEAKWVAEYADLYNILVAPHYAAGAIGFMANVHVGAVIPRNFVAFEFHQAETTWEDTVTGVEKPLIQNGFAKVPDTPGLGMELNDEFVRSHLAEGETYFQ